MPGFGQARAVQIDLDADMIGMRYPYELNVVADSAAALDGAAAIARTQVRPGLAGQDRGERGPVVADHGTPGHARQRPARHGQPHAAGLGAQRRDPGQCHGGR